MNVSLLIRSVFKSRVTLGHKYYKSHFLIVTLGLIEHALLNQIKQVHKKKPHSLTHKKVNFFSIFWGIIIL